MNIDELERKAVRAQATSEAVLLDPDDVEAAVYWIRSLNKQKDYWAQAYMNRRAYRARAWIKRTFRALCG